MIAQLTPEYVKAARARTLVRLVSYGLFEGRPATTKGQWFNPVVRAHLRTARSLGPHRPPDRPIFLLGVGRSGTTLLGLLLGVHPDVGFLNEPKMMWNLIDPTEDPSGFYNRGSTAHIFRYPRDVTDDMRRTANALYSYYGTAVRAARVVDKYCELTYRRAYLKALFPECRLIAIVRRPSAVIRSVEQWSKDHQRGNEDWWGVNGRKWELLKETVIAKQPDAPKLLQAADRAQTDSERSLLEWIVGMRELVRPDPLAPLDLLVRYEDLVRQPVAEMRRVLRAADLPLSERVDRMASSVVRADSRARQDENVGGELENEIGDLLAALGYR